MKKIIIFSFIIIVLISCSRKEVLFVTDTVYHDLIYSDPDYSGFFESTASSAGFHISILTVPVGNTIPDLSNSLKPYPSDIVVLSPLFNKRVESLSGIYDNRIFLLPDSVAGYSSGNVILTVNDRSEAFVELADEVSGLTNDGLKCAVLFFTGTRVRKTEKRTFVDAYNEKSGADYKNLKIYEIDNIDQKGFSDEIVSNCENDGVDLLLLFGLNYNADIIYKLKEGYTPVIITEDYVEGLDLFYSNVWKSMNFDYGKLFDEFFSLEFVFPEITKEDKIIVKQKSGNAQYYEESRDEKKAEVSGAENNTLKQSAFLKTINPEADPSFIVEKRNKEEAAKKALEEFKSRQKAEMERYQSAYLEYEQKRADASKDSLFSEYTFLYRWEGVIVPEIKK